MTMHRWMMLLLPGLCAGLLILSAGCKGEEGKGEVAEEHAPEKDLGEGRIELPEAALQTIPFKTVTVQRRGLKQEIRATAVIKPNENRLAHVSPRIPGRVIDVKAFLGDNVKRGQILAELDSLELGEAKAEYLKAKANLEVARANYKREERLFQQKISSEKEYLGARGEFLRSDTQLKATREALRLLDLTDKEINTLAWGGGEHPLFHFPLIAPFSGTVVEKHITLGELLKPEDKPYTIADLSTLWIQLDIYEKDLARVSTGMEVALQVESYPQDTFHGRVAYVGDLLNETTRTVPARVEIDNRAGQLKPGMFATATITSREGGEEKTVLAVPATAVQRIEGKPAVFVQMGEGSFARRWVTLGESFDQWIEVVGGVEEGEQVVSEGSFTLKSELLKDTLAGEE